MNQHQQVRPELSRTLPTTGVLVGLFLAVWCAVSLVQHFSADHSVPVRGLVVESATLPAASALDRIWPRHVFAYRYLYQGELYLGRAYRTGGGSGEAVRRYGVGAAITVWIDPGQPEKGVVETGLPSRDLALLAVALVLLTTGLIRFVRLTAARRELRAGFSS